MRILSILATIFMLTNPSFAHVGHVGELAGHAHWVGVAAAVAAAAIAVAVAKGKKVDEAEQEPETDTNIELGDGNSDEVGDVT